ncbi:hypothetical protein [Kangiella koreensis]|uniref:Lipoprotein n=1 Tax=Kangiella koreensis (strain DSM 16069 / JCM 12317 / KCTC 12182 / SW-125) TaxID=523791 RepID=C7R740_KANKD|nr:hypothetical protein [Kangiella koreensis]ACV27496.1 conserved hypothetical protein [Kangiella koreensis DSM 16069]
MKRILILISGLLLIAACKTVPVYDVHNEPVNNVSGQSDLTLEQVEKVIVGAAIKRGWKPRIVSPGLVEARLDLRQHTAIINIAFTSSSYSINYVDSQNLHYDDGKIHRNYNNWITNLSRDIQLGLWEQTSR